MSAFDYLDLEDLNLAKEGAYNGSLGYKNSKLANIMFTLKLSRILANDHVIVNTMCPGELQPCSQSQT